MCICDYVKNRIVTCEKCIFSCEKGISELVSQVAPKHTALLRFLDYFYYFLILFDSIVISILELIIFVTCTSCFFNSS